MQNWSGIHTSEDARRIAKKRLPWMVFDYFDGAAGAGLGDELNQQAIAHMRLQTRICNCKYTFAIYLHSFARICIHPLATASTYLQPVCNYLQSIYNHVQLHAILICSYLPCIRRYLHVAITYPQPTWMLFWGVPCFHFGHLEHSWTFIW